MKMNKRMDDMKWERMFHAPPWRTGVLIHPATARKYDDSDLCVTKNG